MFVNSDLGCYNTRLDIESSSRLHCCECWLLTEWSAPDIDGECLHKSAHSTGVSLYEAGARWTFIPLQSRVVILAYFSWDVVQLNCTFFCEAYITLGRNDSALGAERPRNWGGMTAFGADVGRIDPGRIDRYPTQSSQITVSQISLHRVFHSDVIICLRPSLIG